MLLAAALVIGAGWFAAWALAHIDADRKASIEVYVPPGAGLRKVRNDIEAAGASLPKMPFLLLARVSGNERSIRAGAYEILPGMSPWNVLQQLRRGRVVQSSIMIPEGWTFAQIRTRILANDDFAHEISDMTESEILDALGASEASLEGLFFPDNYFFDKRSSDLDLLRRAYRTNLSRLDEAWSSRSPDSPLRSPYEALILASIIEKESGHEEDRLMIGSVFNNRLRRGMRLQSDPTVIYGMGEAFDGNLRKRDLTTETPYNTYTIPRLPPSPIASASLASMKAATAPVESKALYFVARGDGSSEFSETLVDHTQAVRRFQLKGSSR